MLELTLQLKYNARHKFKYEQDGGNREININLDEEGIHSLTNQEWFEFQELINIKISEMALKRHARHMKKLVEAGKVIAHPESSDTPEGPPNV